jgi:hypothetical protein
MPRTRCWLLLLHATLAACADRAAPGDAGDTTEAADGSSDAGDATDAADGSGDAGDTTEAADGSGDAGDTTEAADGSGDAGDTGQIPDDWQTRCPEPPAGPEPAAGRWNLSLFHFNIQYVAGGTEGFAEIASNAPAAAGLFDLSEREVEDRIVTESVVPLLEILERHPTMALTFELQGYAADVIRERHPEVRSRMAALVAEGRLELASIHWSDQFFLAFGRRDMDVSWELTQQSFARAGLPLSPVVFTQEGQFGPGFASWLAAKRPDAVMVIPSNLSRFYAQSFADAPLLRYGALTSILPRGFSSGMVDRGFSFFDDGELAATADLNPYVGRAFVRNAGAIRDYEIELMCAERNGYRVGRIEDYVQAVRGAGAEPVEHPPLLDGTWQPRSTRGPLRWMGGAGDLWGRHERDLAVLTACVEARHDLLTLETLLAAPGEASAPALGAAAASRDEAWRELLWGQVSDARGVNPWHGEVEYGLRHCRAASDGARGATVALGLAGYPGFRVSGLLVDTRAGTIREGGSLPEPAEAAVEAPFAIELEANGRAATASWTAWRDEEDAEVLTLRVDWPAIEGEAARYMACTGGDESRRWDCVRDPVPMEVRLPRRPGFVGLVPALSEELVRHDEADFDLQDEARSDAAWVPVASGLIDLGDGWFAVKEVTTTHVAVGWPAGSPQNAWVRLRNETLQGFEEGTWRIWVTRSEAAARRLAVRNEWPLRRVAIR